jgi:hypothetical protein
MRISTIAVICAIAVAFGLVVNKVDAKPAVIERRQVGLGSTSTAVSSNSSKSSIGRRRDNRIAKQKEDW